MVLVAHTLFYIDPTFLHTPSLQSYKTRATLINSERKVKNESLVVRKVKDEASPGKRVAVAKKTTPADKPAGAKKAPSGARAAPSAKKAAVVGEKAK